MSVTINEIDPPNYTHIPNIIFDCWMPKLSSEAFITLIHLYRQTILGHQPVKLDNEPYVKSHKNSFKYAIQELMSLRLIQESYEKDSYVLLFKNFIEGRDINV